MRPLGWLLVTVSVTAAPQDAGPAPEPASLPEGVEALFAEKGDDDAALLGEEERAALRKLPSHTLAELDRKLEAGMVGGAAHLGILLSLDLSPQSAELVFTDNCLLCHSDPEVQAKRHLLSPDPAAAGSPPHLDLKHFLSDVHFRHGLMCAGCHGGSPHDEEMTAAIKERWPKKEDRTNDRAWIIGFCGRCHSDAAFMRGFNPALPTDQVAKYEQSQHGLLLLQRHDSKAAQCVSCHGVHGILDPRSRLSKVHPLQIPNTCGRCHADAEYMAGYTREDGTPLPTNQLELYRTSVHGKALLDGDHGAPACNDCHGNHAAMPPKVASVAQVCRTCHSQNGSLFDGSKHKRVFEKNGWPECGACHGNHGIEAVTDALISTAPDGLCGSCHRKHASDNTECDASADYFRATIFELAGGARELEGRIERLAERGLDVDRLVVTRGELEEALVQARSRVHAFDRGEFDVAADPGRQTLRQADALVGEANAEYRFRRNGLLAAIGVMGFLAVVLGLKIRELNRRRR